jgi:hydroxyacylglutathione hydrolase
LLVLENDGDLDEVVRLFLRTGFTKFAGYLVGGMKAWDNAGFSFAQISQISVHELHGANGQLQVLDVRTDPEWKGGHVPHARHIAMPQLRQRAGELDKSKPVAVYCASGYRASIATSILRSEGFEKVMNVPGSWHAWKEAGLPVEKSDR